MLLVGLGRAGAEVAYVLSVVFADQHVDPRGVREVEARLWVAQDLVEVRRHAPPGALAVEQPEGEGRTAQHVGVEGLRAESPGERLGGETRALRQRVPHA